ncbi:MAG: AMP-binding protein, partial [Candidatus Binatia bacterium]
AQERRDVFTLPPDQAQILRELLYSSGGAVEFAEADVESSIPARFRTRVRLYGDRLALIAGNDRVTYSELDRAANRVARALLAQRGPAGEPVALLLETGVKAIVALLGVLKAGKAYVPLEPSYPPARLSLMLIDSQAAIVITERSMFDVVQPTDARQTQVLDINEILAGVGDEDVECRAAPGDFAYIMYTSGSAGEPKGVVQNHRNILHKIFTHTHDYRICPDDRITLLYSYSFSASVRCIFGALLNGAALLIYDVKRQPLAEIAQRLIDDRASLYLSVPTLFREVAVALAGIKMPCSLRLVYLASEAVSKPDLDLYKRCFPETCILVHELASGETGTVRQHFFCKTTEIPGDLVPVGYEVRDVEVLLLDENQAPVGSNRISEIAVRSRFLSPGYWRRPDLTQAK